MHFEQSNLVDWNTIFMQMNLQADFLPSVFVCDWWDTACGACVWESGRRDIKRVLLVGRKPGSAWSDLDKLPPCCAAQHGCAADCPSAVPDRRRSLDACTIESFFGLRWSTLTRRAEIRHCAFSKIPQSLASSVSFLTLTFSLPADTPLIPSPLSYDALSNDCSINTRRFNFSHQNWPFQIFVRKDGRFCSTAMTARLSHRVWIWIICYDGWTCVVTSCPDACQSSQCVNRNVENNERNCPRRPCSQTQIIIIMIPPGLFVYLLTDLFSHVLESRETAVRLQTSPPLMAILGQCNRHGFNVHVSSRNTCTHLLLYGKTSTSASTPQARLSKK